MREGIGLRSGLFSLIGIVVSILVVGIVAAKSAVDNQRELLAIFDRRVVLQRTFVNIVDQDFGVRGYVATGNRLFLQPYASARGQIAQDFAALDGGSPAFRGHVREMERLYRLWLSDVGEPLLARPARPDAIAREIRGKFILDGIRAAGHAARLLVDADVDAKVNELSRINAIALGTIVVLVVVFGAAGISFGRERLLAEVRLKEALAQRNADLERSNQSLEEFAYVASHDLQEPLRAMAGFSQLLKARYAGKLDGEADEFIGYIVDGAERMKVLIDDILQYSRVTTHGSPLAAVDLTGVAGAAVRNLQASISARGAQIVYGALPVVEGDAPQLVQLMQNLIGNAIKYNRSEPPRVQIDAARDECGEWVVRVKDNGIGIDPAYHERIFRVFARLHTRTEFPGTGIGLAIARRIVERHGGRIWVESVEGSGATFAFTLRPATKGAA